MSDKKENWAADDCRVFMGDGGISLHNVPNGVERARLIAAAPDMYGAAHFAKVALATLEAYEADGGGPLDDMHELGRIYESSGMPSFRIRVGHIRALAAAIAKATGS